MKRTAAIFLLFIAVFAGMAPLRAQLMQPQLTSAEILQGLQKLNTIGSALYVAAHPDDENTRLLSYLSNERNVRTGYLSITRGDGGQNLIGKEQAELLGLIRTQELLAARRTDGAEQFFTRANDFGYSKSPEETLNFWNKDSVLADMVWVIRNFKPDVIICRFPTTGEGGHGHHTASAILALEAFDAAADPKRFPQQLKYTSTWQAKSIYWNTFNFGSRNTTSPDQLKIDVGGYNPLLGKSYGEIAAESRSMHKSQGFGSGRVRGTTTEYFKFLKGEEAKDDLFENIDLSWERVTGNSRLTKAIRQVMDNYTPLAPEKSIPALKDIYRQIQQLPEKEAFTRHWKAQKLKECQKLLLACAGLWLEAETDDFVGIPGRPVEITSHIIKRNESDVTLEKISWLGQQDSTAGLDLKLNEFYSFKHMETLPQGMPFSNPYWLNDAHGTGAYIVKDQELRGKPENEAAGQVTFHLAMGDLKLQVQRPLVYKSTDPVKGEVYRPYTVLPPATVNLSDKAFVFDGVKPRTLQFVIKANAANTKGTLNAKAPKGWTVKLDKKDFDLKRKGDEAVVEATITPSRNSKDGMLELSLSIDGREYNKAIERIEYDHIPYQFMLKDAQAELINLDLKKGGTNIGYIPGAGDDVPAALRQVGYTVTILTDDMLLNGDLSRFDAIVSGIRAYNVNERMQIYYDRLMEYVKNGGNLVVQYNTNTRYGPVIDEIGPYPFFISRNRVTDETAQIRMTNKEHPALNYPNKITNKDFEGWIQERGIYFAEKLEGKYETVLSINDPGEEPHEGSLIIAPYGKGNFVYTGLVFFRELPAGVPGAYRLFVNLLSLPENKADEK